MFDLKDVSTKEASKASSLGDVKLSTRTVGARSKIAAKPTEASKPGHADSKAQGENSRYEVTSM